MKFDTSNFSDIDLASKLVDAVGNLELSADDLSSTLNNAEAAYDDLIEVEQEMAETTDGAADCAGVSVYCSKCESWHLAAKPSPDAGVVTQQITAFDILLTDMSGYIDASGRTLKDFDRQLNAVIAIRNKLGAATGLPFTLTLT